MRNRNEIVESMAADLNPDGLPEHDAPPEEVAVWMRREIHALLQGATKAPLPQRQDDMNEIHLIIVLAIDLDIDLATEFDDPAR